MKKLIIAGMIAAAAVVANAATFSWKTSTTGKLYEAGTTTAVSSGTAYLFDASSYTMATIVQTVLSGSTLDSLTSLSSQSVSSGAIASKSFDVPAGYAGGDAFNAIIAFASGDDIFVQSVATTTPGTGDKLMTLNLKSASQAAAIEFKAGDSISTAGWYTAAAVPEPTSGLLLLLGIAGLALKRKHA